MRRLEVETLPGMPEVVPGDDLARRIAAAVQAAGAPIGAGDVLVVVQKVVSKAEGRLRALSEIEPNDEAERLAAELGKDARVVQAILDETEAIVRAERGVLITRTRHGFVCANAGVDSSNVAAADVVCLLPTDPDASARELRSALGELLGHSPAIVISDSFGRAWRVGQVDVAIGCAGLAPLDDLRGSRDASGRELGATITAVADAAAAAAALVRRKAEGDCVAVVRGLERYVTSEDGPGAHAIARAAEEDLFR